MKFQLENKPLTIFNFSSLTDIVMLLLIFFLLTSSFVVNTGIKVKLPGSKNNEKLLTSKLVLSITADGSVTVGSNPVLLENLAIKLQEIVAQTKENNLIIRADVSSKHGIVMKVIDIAKGIGIQVFTIQTEKENF